MATAQLPTLDFINLNLVQREWLSALQEMFSGLREHHAIANPERAWSDLVARSSAGFTALHADVALPHARTSAVGRLVFAAGRSLQGISFGSEAPAVRLVFVVLTPKEKPNEYLQLLASLSRRIREASVREQLIGAPDAQQFASILEGHET